MNAFDRPEFPLAIQKPYGPKPKTDRVVGFRKPQGTAGLKKRLARKNPLTALGSFTTKKKI